MKKKSYNNLKEDEVGPETKGPSNNISPSDTSAEGGFRGFNSVEMPYYYNATDPSEYDENVSSNYKSKDISVDKKVLDILLMLGDEMDNANEVNLANFSNFLISKFAQQNIDDEYEIELMLKKLLIKVKNADLPNTNDVIKKLTKIFSRTFLLELVKNNDIEKSRKSAYKKTLHRAGQYLSE